MRQKPLIRILLIDSTIAPIEAIAGDLRREGYAIRPRLIASVGMLGRSLEDHVWDLVLCAGRVGDPGIAEGVALVKKSGQDAPFIALYQATDAPVPESIVHALRAGATDAVERDNHEHLYYAIRKELQRLERRREARNLKLMLKRYAGRYRYLLRSSTDAIACVVGARHLFATEKYARIFGFADFAAFRDQSILDLIVDQDREAFADLLKSYDRHSGEPLIVDVSCRGVGGREFAVRLEVSNATYEDEECLQVMIWETPEDSGVQPAVPPPAGLHSERGAPGDTPAALAARTHDPVTHFLQSSDFEAVVEDAIRQAVNKNAQSALLYLELDNFDKMSALADAREALEYLQDVAALILVNIEPNDIAARLEPDTFAILLKEKSLSHAHRVAEGIAREVRRHMATLNRHPVSLQCHIGVVPISGSHSSYRELIVNGFSACHAAKHAADGRVQVHSTEAEQTVLLESAHQLTREVLEALDQQRFSLVYQPIVRVSGEPLELYEVLLRVQDRAGAEIPTDAVIPVAHKHRMETAIDEWVIENALAILGDRLRRGHDTHFFIKLSQQAIRDEHTVLLIGKQLRRHRIPGGQLIFELSETYVADNGALVRAFLKVLREFKCGAAIEHFGAGINSLKIAGELPFDYLKIDSPFVAHLAHDHEAMASLRAITRLAAQTGKLTIAECVENVEILTALFHCGVDFVEGVYIQPPSELLEFDFSSTSLE